MCCIMGYAGHDLPKETFTEYLLRTTSRGPDDQRVVETEFGLLGFGRLAIMGLTPEGMQPFFRGADCVACNGELYGFRPVKASWRPRATPSSPTPTARSCCRSTTSTVWTCSASGRRVCHDSVRQPQRPPHRRPRPHRHPPAVLRLQRSGQIAFASEAKNLVGLCKKIYPFPIGSYYCNGHFVRYCDIADMPAPSQDDLDTVLTNIREKLIAGVEKRLDADAPVGFLLSGGLDSSLVCAIAAKKLGKPIRTFAIGMERRRHRPEICPQVAEYLGSRAHRGHHQPGYRHPAPGRGHRLLGTWDITTIRASMGMYLLCKAIHEQTDVRVLLTGEISDELFGYKYTDYAPTADAFQQESQKRIRELYMYDVLRADRCISANSIEARVPFGDLDFVRTSWPSTPKRS